jgi:hypothetical protein
MLCDSIFEGNELLCRISSYISISFCTSVFNGRRFILSKKYLIMKYYIVADDMKFQFSLC